ncbi:MAG TPA: hypothetical protein VGG11_05740 [Xanthobacteraceae bacterium]
MGSSSHLLAQLDLGFNARETLFVQSLSFERHPQHPASVDRMSVMTPY